MTTEISELKDREHFPYFIFS